MKIKRYIELDGLYDGLIADIGCNMNVKEVGVVFIVIDFERYPTHPSVNIIPSKVIHIDDVDFFSLYEIDFYHIVIKKINFENQKKEVKL